MESNSRCAKQPVKRRSELGANLLEYVVTLSLIALVVVPAAQKFGRGPGCVMKDSYGAAYHEGVPNPIEYCFGGTRDGGTDEDDCQDDDVCEPATDGPDDDDQDFEDAAPDGSNLGDNPAEPNHF